MKYILFILFVVVLIFVIYRLKQFYKFWLIVNDEAIKGGRYSTTESRLFNFTLSVWKVCKNPRSLKMVLSGSYIKIMEALSSVETVTYMDNYLNQVDTYVESVVEPMMNELLYSLKTLTGSYHRAYLYIHMFLYAGVNTDITSAVFLNYRSRLSNQDEHKLVWLDTMNNLRQQTDADYSLYMKNISVALQNALDQRVENTHPDVDTCVDLIVGHLLNERKLKNYFGPSFPTFEELTKL